jgi:hypothetical protein
MICSGRNGRLRGRDTGCRDGGQCDEKSASHFINLSAPRPVRKRFAYGRVPK